MESERWVQVFFWQSEQAEFRCHSAFLGVIVRLRVRSSSHQTHLPIFAAGSCGHVARQFFGRGP